MLEAFEHLTGYPILVNTSLNGPGEPMVETPEQAIEFYNTHPDVDGLLLEDQLVRRVPRPWWRGARLAPDTIVSCIYPLGKKRIILIRRAISLEVSERAFAAIEPRPSPLAGEEEGDGETGEVVEAVRLGLCVPADPDAMELRTPRLRLEPIEPRHAAILFQGLQGERLYEFIADTPPKSVEALSERYARLASRRSPDGRERWLNWAIFCQETERYIGYVQATIAPRGAALIAYVLFEEHWGHGYAGEAVARMIEHLVAAYHVSELCASVDVRNQRSIALLDRLGFERVAVRKDAEIIRGAPSDEAEYRRRACLPDA